MKRWMTTGVLSVVLLLTFLIVMPAYAAPAQPDDLVLALPLPDFQALDVPSSLVPVAAERYAAMLTYRMAQPLRDELARLRIEGEIAGYEVRPDLHAIVVSGATAEAAARLSQGQDLNGVFDSVATMPACATRIPGVLAEQALAQSLMSRHVRPLSPDATNPTIDVQIYPASTRGYGNVYGVTAPEIEVTLRVWHEGEEVVEKTTTSDDTGAYAFSPEPVVCPEAKDYDFGMYTGDIIEVAANGNTVTTTVVSVTAWVDPDTNVVGGTTDPSRTVSVTLQATADTCVYDEYVQSATPDGSGNFSTDFTAAVDFDRRAEAAVYALDANGNSTYIDFYAYRLFGYFTYPDYVFGYLKPETNFTATLSRGGGVIATRTGSTNGQGYLFTWFSGTQAGDVVSVTADGANVAYALTEMVDFELDPVADEVTGITGAGRLVVVDADKRSFTDGYVQTTCEETSTCATTLSGTAGDFVVDLQHDYARGDIAAIYVFDDEGNLQFDFGLGFPAIVANMQFEQVEGYWHRGNEEVTAILKDGGGVVKAVGEPMMTASDGGFEVPMTGMVVGDIIEVGNGTLTETMTIQDVTAGLDSSTGHLTGAAYDDVLLAQLWDFRRPDGRRAVCEQTTVTGGVYDVVVGGAEVAAQDYAYVWSTGPNGHYTKRAAYAFTVAVKKEGWAVDGYTMSPNVPVTVTLVRGGLPVVTATTTSGSYGQYATTIPEEETLLLSQDDTIRVVTGDGDSADVLIPALTAYADGPNNSVSGIAPANQGVLAHLRRRSGVEEGGWAELTASGYANAAGEYSVPFNPDNDLYWLRDCSLVDTDDPCVQVAVHYFDAAEHEIYYDGPYPEIVGPDAFEVDDTYMLATTYTGIQSHTFHAVTDTDWISFTVTADDIADQVPFRVRTLNLGWGMATRVRIYRFDTMLVQVFDQTAYEEEGEGLTVPAWLPLEAGLYYMVISPPNHQYAAYCEAVYDVEIFATRSTLYFPVIFASYIPD